MKLYINGRFLTQQTTGVQQFAIEICKQLVALYPNETIILIPKGATLFDNQFNKYVARIGLFKGHIWEQISLPLYLCLKKNYTLFNLCNTAPVALKNQIVTIHDIAFKINPRWFSFWFSSYYRLLIPIILKRCKHVVTVSQTIKNELITHYKVTDINIHILYNKVSQTILSCQPKKVSHQAILTNKFYLMVGTNNPRKNFNSVETLFKSNPDKILVIVGGNHNAFKQTKLINASNIIRLSYLNTPELKWLYINATALINPSLYEGFGIPNIEAMALGCLMVCNDLPVFREICADVPYYFSSQDLTSLNLILNQLTTNSTENLRKKDKGLVQFKTIQQYNNEAVIINLLNQ